MTYKLYLFVEGTDDLRFIKYVFIPEFSKRYARIKFIKYAQMKPVVQERMLRAIQQSGADYIYLKDFDRNKCITETKEKLVMLLNKTVHPDNIAIVVKTIECWYLCILSQKSCHKVLGQPVKCTENFTKTKFDRLIPKKTPRVDFLMNILKDFSVVEGKKKNKSFKYFVERWIEPL